MIAAPRLSPPLSVCLSQLPSFINVTCRRIQRQKTNCRRSTQIEVRPTPLPSLLTLTLTLIRDLDPRPRLSFPAELWP